MDLILEENSVVTAPEVNSGAALNTRTYVSKSIEDRLAQYDKDAELREQALSRTIPFISPDFRSFCELTQGLTLIGACSGTGKSTTSANLLAGFIDYCSEGEAVVISNEESSEAVYNRIACLLLNESFFNVHKNKVSLATKTRIKNKVKEIVKRIEVVDDPAWDMTCLEDVEAVLEFASKSKKQVRLVVVDYLQTVAFSREKQFLEPFQVSKILGLYLKDYGRRVGVPVVVFAQIKPKSDSPDFTSRVQNDKTIYNHAFSVIEIVPDFKNRTTSFILHKDRFGLVQGKEIVTEFKDGKYVSVEI